jgi:hypothetical protein
MAEGAIFLNSGPLFSGERLETMEDLPEWQAQEEATRDAFERIRESYEKHATLLAGAPSVEETRFFIIGPALHALGFTHSATERLDVSDSQQLVVDYTCFANSVDFRAAAEARGGIGFFRTSLAVVRTVAWGRDLDGADTTLDEDGEPTDAPSVVPSQELDAWLRSTGCTYGILTNGCDWRVYHRGTSGLLSTFFQADMISAMKSDFEEFRRFFLLFGKQAIQPDDSGTCLLDRLLQ